MTPQITAYGKRLEAIRRRAGKTCEEISTATGLSFESCRDLELHDDEIIKAVSLAELRRLSHVLGFELRDFFCDSSENGQTTLSLNELADCVKIYVNEQNITIEQFEERVGWEVAEAVKQPARFLDYNLAGLMEISGAVGVDWCLLL